MFPAKEPLSRKIIIRSLFHPPGLFESPVPGARTPIGEVMGLLSSGGKTLGATAESGARGCSPADQHQCAALPGVSQSAQILPASPAALSSGASTVQLFTACSHLQDPLLHRRQLPQSWTAPALTPQLVHFPSASVAAPIPSPFLGCGALGPQKRDRPRERRGCTREGKTLTPAQLLSGLGDPQFRSLCNPQAADPGGGRRCCG